jgi:hypothetical protein
MGRGPHAADEALFEVEQHAVLRRAVGELGWLLERGYAEPSACKLVGDRHRLQKRQRLAVRRSACPESSVRSRAARRVGIADLRGEDIAIDGFNCIITVEAALAHGVVLRGCDGAVRDMASVHGSYRQVEVTRMAIEHLTALLCDAAVERVTWYLDRPVSNSGRLAEVIEALAPPQIRAWTVELPFDPDRVLLETSAVVATSDSRILDACGAWVDLPAAIIERSIPDAWLVDLRPVEV